MRYKKKPIEIEARQLDMDNREELAEWCGGWTYYSSSNVPVLLIETLEGDMTANIGDYIIQGVHGEYYPCKPEIFEASYEMVVDPQIEWGMHSPAATVRGGNA